MKYIIVWVLSWLSVAPCPTLRDEFNRQSECQFSAVEEKSRMHSRVFDNRDSAFVFFRRLEAARLKQETAPTEFIEKIESVKIDSIR